MTDGRQEVNAVGRMLGLLGDEWTLLIVRESLLGATRFTDFTAMPTSRPISTAVLTNRLRALVDDGLLDRTVYQEQPLRAAYLPTDRCRTLWPVLVSIWHWERTWVPDHARTLPAMGHDGCGRECSPVLRCAACRHTVAETDLTGGWGPSGGWARSVPRATTRRRARTGAQAGLFPETMAIFGNRWASAIIGAAFLGTRRFTDFQSRLGAPTAVVAEHLRAFYPVVASAIHWAEQWFGAPEGPALDLRHTACGADFVPQLGCDQCGEALTAGTVRVLPGGAERRDPVRPA